MGPHAGMRSIDCLMRDWVMEKILIVDDNKDLRRLLHIALGEGKYQLLEADHGELAIEVAEREKPDVILLDVMMPGMDGFEVCKRLRANPALYKSFIIMLTSLDQFGDHETGVRAGADYYITKPFSLSRLKTVIEKVRTGSISAEEFFRQTINEDTSQQVGDG